MFDEIGNKIKVLAKVFCWIGIIGSIIIGCVIMKLQGITGLFIAIGGSLLSWINSFVLYGFGQLIENSDIIATESKRNNKRHHEAVERKEEQRKTQRTQEIKTIVRNDSIDDNQYIDMICPSCGKQLSFTKSDLSGSENLACPWCDSAIDTSDYK